jgi:hypothetical protein
MLNIWLNMHKHAEYPGTSKLLAWFLWCQGQLNPYTYLREFEIIKMKSSYCPDYGDALLTIIGLVVTMIFSIQEYEYLMR